MIRKFAFFIITLVFSATAFSQKMNVRITMDNRVADAKSDTIYYNPNRLLTWSDFQGEPKSNNVAGAMTGAVTASGFAFNASMNMRDNVVNLNVNVYTYFSKKNSWKKPDIGTAYHLLHEQRHFDITRLGAQKFYTELHKTDFTLSNYTELLSSIFKKVSEDNNILQQKYDSETRNSMNTTEQLQWNDKIADELKRLY